MPSLSNYICVKCEKEMRPKKNGIYVEEHIGYDQPYKIWHADLWECLMCGIQIIAGFSRNPVAENYETENYNRIKPEVEFHIRETTAEVQSG